MSQINMKKYTFVTSAYHEISDKDEVLVETISFNWDQDDISGSVEYALSKAFKKWSENEGYYGQEAKEVGGE